MSGLLRLIVAGFLVGFLGVGGGCSTGSTTGPSDGYVTGQGLVTLVPPAERVPAPLLTGPVLGEDRTISTADFRGKVVVVNVWAHWCPPCRAEAPDLQRASTETRQVAQFVGLNTRDTQEAAPLRFLEQAGVTYPNIYDPDGSLVVSLAQTLPPNAFPTTMVIDRDGRVAARIAGATTRSTMVGLVTDIAAGR